MADQPGWSRSHQHRGRGRSAQRGRCRSGPPAWSHTLASALQRTADSGMLRTRGESVTTYSFASARIAEVKETGDHIATTIGTVLSGKMEQIRLALTVLLAEGHLLIEDVPG